MTDTRPIEKSEVQHIAFNQEIAPFSVTGELIDAVRVLPNVGEVVFTVTEERPSAFVLDPRLITASIKLLESAEPERWFGNMELVAYKVGPNHTVSDSRFSVAELGPNRSLEFNTFDTKLPRLNTASGMPKLSTDVTPMKSAIPNPAVRHHLQALHARTQTDTASPFQEDVTKLHEWKFKFIDMQNSNQIA